MFEDNDLLDRLSSSDNTPGADNDDSAVRIRVEAEEADPRDIAAEALRRAEEEERQGRDIAQEYHDKYYGDGETARKRRRADAMAAKSTVQERLRRIDWRLHTDPVVGVSAEERQWAALAHASFLLTIVIGMVTEGWLGMFAVFIPLLIYFRYRDSSEFVAFHALQAFAVQIVGTIGWVALLVVGSLLFGVAIAISAIASVLLIGIPFLLLFVALYLIFIVAMIAVPLVAAVLSAIGAFSTYSGKNFRYPLVANWIDRQNSGTIMTV